MPAPLLVTKLFVPVTRPELVRRPRLMNQLDAGLARKSILISAPAGFGKTHLVAWARKHVDTLKDVRFVFVEEGEVVPDTREAGLSRDRGAGQNTQQSCGRKRARAPAARMLN